MPNDDEDCPVQQEVCKARMGTLDEKIKALDSKITYLFGTSILMIAIEIATLALRGK